MKTYVVITIVLLVCFMVSSCEEADSTVPSPAGTADLGTVAQRWNGLTEEEREAVCTEADAPLSPERDARPDYRGMLGILMAAGLKQEDATAMLPYAVNKCT